MSTPLRSLAPWLILLAAWGVQTDVQAQGAPGSPPADRGAPPAGPVSASQRAIELGRQGLSEYEAQKWAACAASFEQAEALNHSPVFQLYQARCLRGDKKLLRARDLLRSVAKEAVADDAPGPFRQARIDAQAELGLLERTIPSVVVTVVGADPAGLKLFVNQRSISAGAPVELDPGSHEASAMSGATARQTTFQVVEGQKNLAVELQFDAAGPGTDPTSPPPPPANDTGSSGGLVAGGVVLAVGGAAAIAGAILGGLALSGYGELEDDGCDEFRESGELLCNGNIADDSAQDDFESANAFADASTGLLISGGITAAVGLIVMIAVPADVPLQARANGLAWVF